MQMTESRVYADLTFLINFTMDFIILWATARLVGVPIAYLRLAAAALLGGVYAVGYLFPALSPCYSLPLKLGFSIILVVIGVLPRTWHQFTKSLLLFYGINFMAAGASIGISFLLQGENGSSSYSYLWLLGGIACVVLLGSFGKRVLINRIIPRLLKFPVQLTFDNNHCCGEGFLDTGNGLRDPLTNRPVIVAEYRLLKECLPADLQNALEESQNQEEMLEKLSRSSWANRLRLIPFSSIGKKNGLMIGIRADQIKVAIDKTDIEHNNLVVGIYPERLSAQDRYQLLIPSEILDIG